MYNGMNFVPSVTRKRFYRCMKKEMSIPDRELVKGWDREECLGIMVQSVHWGS